MPTSTLQGSEILAVTFEKDKKIDFTAQLLKDRVIFLNAEIDPETASNIVTYLYLLNKEDPEKPIKMWLFSPGGMLEAFYAIYDMMNMISAPVETICIGEVCSAAAIILASGSKGMRYAMPNSRIMIHQIQVEGLSGSNSELETSTKDLKQAQDRLTEILARHTGHTKTKIKKDTKNDKYMKAEEALAYGLIDHILPVNKKIPELVEKENNNKPE